MSTSVKAQDEITQKYFLSVGRMWKAALHIRRLAKKWQSDLLKGFT
jgi:hypothetical protein